MNRASFLLKILLFIGINNSHEIRILPSLGNYESKIDTDPNPQTVMGDFVNWITSHSATKLENIRVLTSANEDSSFIINTLLSDSRCKSSLTVTLGSYLTYKDISIPSIVLIHIDSLNRNPEPENFYNHIDLSGWIKKFASRKLDHFLFVGKEESIKIVWNNPILNPLKWKWGYATDSNNIFVPISQADKPLDPSVFDSVELLEQEFKTQEFATGHNIKGRRYLTTAWDKCTPYFFVAETYPDGRMDFDGMNFRIFNESFQRFNFSIDLRPSFDATYGEYLPNKTWTGMIGEMLYKQYDICMQVGPQIVWNHIFDYSMSLTDIQINFVTVKPTLELHWQAFFHPFSNTVWILLLLACLTVTFCMYMVLKFGHFMMSFPMSSNNVYSKISKLFASENSLFLSFMVPYKIALEQHTPIPKDARVLTSAWLLAIIILATAYKTEIMSSLTLPTPTKVPTTISELVARHDYTAIINAVGEIELNMYQTSELPKIKELMRRGLFEESQYNCLIATILRPKTVCFSWCPLLLLAAAEKTTVDLSIDPYVLSNDAVANSYLAIGFAKDSPYVDGFEPIIAAFFESGIYGMWETDIYMKQRKKGYSIYKNSTSSTASKKLISITDELKGIKGLLKPLKIKHLKIMFFIETIGLLLAIIGFVFEMLSTSSIVLTRKLRKKFEILKTLKVELRSIKHNKKATFVNVKSVSSL